MLPSRMDCAPARRDDATVSADSPGEFQSILAISRAGVDAAVVEGATRLAAWSGARLTVVELLERRSGPLHDEIEALERAERVERLGSTVAPLLERGLAVTTEVLVGKPWMEVVRAVLRGGHDLVMFGAEEHDVRLDSFALHLLRKCPCPVWALRPGRPQRVHKVLAAVAAGPDDEHDNAIDAPVLDVAIKLAAHAGAELHVVHAWRMPGQAVLRQRSGMSDDDIDALLRDWRDAADRGLQHALRHHDLARIGACVHLLEGEAREVIPEFAAQEHVDLVVMGTAGRAGIAGFFIGNTAEDVIQRVPCAVLAVKPDGFVTPVQVC